MRFPEKSRDSRTISISPVQLSPQLHSRLCRRFFWPAVTSGQGLLSPVAYGPCRSEVGQGILPWPIDHSELPVVAKHQGIPWHSSGQDASFGRAKCCLKTSCTHSHHHDLGTRRKKAGGLVPKLMQADRVRRRQRQS